MSRSRPPPHNGTDTSRAAAEAIEPRAGTLRRLVLDLIRGAGGAGMTDDEIEARTGLRHQTASARRRELVQLGLVGDSGERRPTRSGCKAIVWVDAGLVPGASDEAGQLSLI